jgi:uncharacterized iron-regulated membrane protein
MKITLPIELVIILLYIITIVVTILMSWWFRNIYWASAIMDEQTAWIIVAFIAFLGILLAFIGIHL